MTFTVAAQQTTPDSVVQEFGKEIARTVCLCSIMYENSAGKSQRLGQEEFGGRAIQGRIQQMKVGIILKCLHSSA